jgi:GAG-pre-integrase domain
MGKKSGQCHRRKTQTPTLNRLRNIEGHHTRAHQRNRKCTRNQGKDDVPAYVWFDKQCDVDHPVPLAVAKPIEFHLTPYHCVSSVLRKRLLVPGSYHPMETALLIDDVLEICQQFRSINYGLPDAKSEEVTVTPTAVRSATSIEDNHWPVSTHSEGAETEEIVDTSVSEDDDEVIYAFSTSMVTHKSLPKQMAPMDTDSFEIKLDNCCSRTLSGHRQDFVKGTLRPKRLAIVGYNGEKEFSTHQGTIRWMIDNDEGLPQEVLIPNSLLVPTNKTRLLSPQHLAQVLKSKETLPSGTRCTTYSDRMVLQWDDLRNTVTVPIDKKASIIGRRYTSPGFHAYSTYAELTDEDFTDVQAINCFRIEVQRDDDIVIHSDDINIDGVPYEPAERIDDGALKVNFDFKPKQLFADNPELTHTEQQEATSSTPEDELLRWHHRLAHVSMAKLQRMAQHNILPSRLARCRIPLCQACVYGKLTRRPWRTKPNANHDTNTDTVTVPGQMVSVDQLESPSPGLYGQMKGILTKRRYKVATVFQLILCSSSIDY